MISTKNGNSRCIACKKTSSFVLNCKCGNNFCSRCILPEKHNCNKLYDFHRVDYERNKETLLKQSINPMASQSEKIFK